MREMQLTEVDVRIDYFHDSSDDHLLKLGVDRASLLSREAWRSFYAEDYACPMENRQNFSLIWELDGETIGFSLDPPPDLSRARLWPQHCGAMVLTDPTAVDSDPGACVSRGLCSSSRLSARW